MAQNTVTIPKVKKPEMWFIDLAKSKVILFAAKSCELVIFFGGLWLTLVMTNHDAANWASGGINNFFITTMGFAVDAAFPESWIHVVAQHFDQKKGQFRWSVSIAIAMSLLVGLNVVSTEIETNAHVNLPVWVTATFITIRMFVGFGYVAIRECQGLLDRKSAEKQAGSPVQPPALDIQKQIEEALAKQAKEQTDMLADLSKRLETATNLSRIENQRLLTTIQEVENAQKTLQLPPPALSENDVVNSVLARLETLFLEQQGMQKNTDQRRALPEQKQSESPQRRSANTGSTEIVKRPKKIDENEVDALVWPMKDKDKSLSVRKLASLVPYSETVVFSSLKRWKEQQPVIVSEDPGDDETAM